MDGGEVVGGVGRGDGVGRGVVGGEGVGDGGSELGLVEKVKIWLSTYMRSLAVFCAAAAKPCDMIMSQTNNQEPRAQDPMARGRLRRVACA